METFTAQDAEESTQRRIRNPHQALDALKHRLSCVVLATFPLAEIRRRSIDNIERWRANGVSGGAYDEWAEIVRGGDDLELIAAMVGLDEKSNQLRQSIPYVGMLPKSVVRRLNEDLAG